jgi:hypothetical protein
MELMLEPSLAVLWVVHLGCMRVGWKVDLSGATQVACLVGSWVALMDGLLADQKEIEMAVQ